MRCGVASRAAARWRRRRASRSSAGRAASCWRSRPAPRLRARSRSGCARWPPTTPPGSTGTSATPRRPRGRAAAARGGAVTLPVTVVVPAYRATETLARALASARAQQPYPPAEILVVDDGSRDGTAALARECGATVLVHEHNRGLAAARNTAVAAATQPWLAFLDADDEWLPHHLATLWPLREGHDLVAGSAIVWDPAWQRARFHGPVRTARADAKVAGRVVGHRELHRDQRGAGAHRRGPRRRRVPAVHGGRGPRPVGAAADRGLGRRRAGRDDRLPRPSGADVGRQPGRAELAPARDRRARRRAVVEPGAGRALPRHARVAPRRRSPTAPDGGGTAPASSRGRSRTRSGPAASSRSSSVGCASGARPRTGI